MRHLPADCNIYLASDLHVGSLGTHYDGIGELIEAVGKGKKNYLILLGDLAEAICCDDKRFDPDISDASMSTPMRQYLRVIELLKPIAGKILYINDGNHDNRHSNTIGFVKDVVCRELDVPYGTYSSKLTVINSTGNTQYKLFTTHGFGSVTSTADDPIRRKANMRLTLKRKLQNKAADVSLMAMGHSHKLLISPPTHALYLYDDGEKVKQDYLKPVHETGTFIHPDHRWFVNTGSFLKNQLLGMSGYAERFGYDPVEIGYTVAEIRDSRIAHVRKVVV
jgi:UDP-2,3-diacylglucosamine pyrophosphatase LpxH